MRHLVAFALAPFVVSSCLDLPEMTEGVCGNGVVDRGEDCDGFVGYEGASCETPGHAASCRYVCSPGDCPPGWGCGTDGICRAPSGAFSEAGGLISGSSARALTGDFDGDGRDELVVPGAVDELGRASVELYFVDREGSVSSRLPIASQAANPIVSALTGHVDDLAFITVGGVGLLYGIKAQQELGAQTYPSRTFDDAQDVRLVTVVGAARQADRFIALVEPEPGRVFARWLDESDDAPPLAEFEGSLTELAAPPFALTPSGVAGAADASACPTLVVAFRGRPELRLLDPCRASVEPALASGAAAPRALRLPTGAALGARVLAGDLNGDGRADLLLGGADGESYAAYGAADGSFRPWPSCEGEIDIADPFALPSIDAIGSGPALAFGDLNLDGAPDFVLPGGVIMSSPAGGYEVAARKIGGRWSEALIGRFNADNYPDIVAATLESTGLDFYTNATDSASGRSLLNLKVIATRGVPALLTAADVDGDLVTDIAFVERSSDAGSAPAAQARLTSGVLPHDDRATKAYDTLAVAFGRAVGAPLAPQRFGSMYAIDQIAASLMSERRGYDTEGASEPDGIYDLTIVYGNIKAPSKHVADLHGRGDRELRAFLELRRSEGEPDFPLGLAAGCFFDDTPDMAVLAIDAEGTLRLWSAPEVDDLTDEGVLVGEPLPSGMRPFLSEQTGDLRQGVPMAAGDLDGDGRDELVFAMPGEGKGKAQLAIVRATGEGGPGSGGRFKPELFAFEAELGPNARVALGDLDGDGALDAALLPEIGERKLFVFLNQGGTLDVSDPVVLVPRENHFMGMATIPAVGGVGHDLVLIEHETAYRTLRGNTPRSFFATLLSGVDGGGEVASGDFDGDGVSDLAIASAGGISIYFGEPVLR